MIRAEFHKSDGIFTGFEISGHSGYAEVGEDIVCAAVSSAVQLSINILSEFEDDFKTNVFVGDNVIRCSTDLPNIVARTVIRSLKEHFESILEEFPDTIKITVLEV